MENTIQTKKKVFVMLWEAKEENKRILLREIILMD